MEYTFYSKFRHGHQRLPLRLLSYIELPMLSTKTSQKWAKRTYTSTIHIFLPISTIFSNFFFHLLHLLTIFANNCLVKAVIFDPTLSLLHDRESRRVAREQCVLADRDGAICRSTLEERAISDLTIFPPEVLVYSVTIIDRLHVPSIASKFYKCFHSFLKIL